MEILSFDGDNARDASELLRGKTGFAKVYHPDCGHCTRMKPAWEALANHAGLKNLNIVIINVHHEAIPQANIPALEGIQGYPTIVEIKPDGKRGREYNGDRSTEDLARFIMDTVKDKSTNHKSTNHKSTKRRRSHHGGGKSSKRKSSKRKSSKRKSSKRKSSKRKSSKRKSSKRKSSKRKSSN